MSEVTAKQLTKLLTEFKEYADFIQMSNELLSYISNNHAAFRLKTNTTKDDYTKVKSSLEELTSISFGEFKELNKRYDIN